MRDKTILDMLSMKKDLKMMHTPNIMDTEIYNKFDYEKLNRKALIKVKSQVELEESSPRAPSKAANSSLLIQLESD